MLYIIYNAVTPPLGGHESDCSRRKTWVTRARETFSRRARSARVCIRSDRIISRYLFAVSMPWFRFSSLFSLNSSFSNIEPSLPLLERPLSFFILYFLPFFWYWGRGNSTIFREFGLSTAPGTGSPLRQNTELLALVLLTAFLGPQDECFYQNPRLFPTFFLLLEFAPALSVPKPSALNPEPNSHSSVRTPEWYALELSETGRECC